MRQLARWGSVMALMAAATLGRGEVRGPDDFGKTADGTKVERFTLSNKNGMMVKIISRGATVTEMHVPDKKGKTADVVLGFDTVAGYESDENQHFGCTTGRVCNRIAKGKFMLDGKEYKLAVNHGEHHLHGGTMRSLDKVLWKGEAIKSNTGSAVRFTYTSPDGEEGYPGKVDFQTTYTLTDNNELIIDWEATTDKATPINLTNHCYFNLGGAGEKTVLDHELQLAAEQYTLVDDTLIPTGKLADVKDTPLDFAKAIKLGARIDALVKTPTKGYDHNFVLKARDKKPTFAAMLRDPQSGRKLRVSTTQPGIQVYTGNFLKDQKGKDGKTYGLRSAVCLETQHFPDSVNQPSFPSVIVKPGQPYRQTCIYAFSAE